MLSSIHPLGEEGRGQRYVITATAFVVGSILGGALTGSTVGLIGVLAGAALAGVGVAVGSVPVRLLLLMVAVVVVAMMVFRRGSLPGLARQVNENWLVEYRGWVYGLGFGLQLGAGVATYIRSGAVLVWLVAVVVVGSFGLPAGLVFSVGIGVAFGLIRGMSILATRSITSPEKLIAFHRRLHGGAELVGAGGGPG